MAMSWKISFSEQGDTATWFGSAIRDPQSQQMSGEDNNLREVNNLGDVSAVVRNSVIYTNAPNPSRVTSKIPDSLSASRLAKLFRKKLRSMSRSRRTKPATTTTMILRSSSMARGVILEISLA
jgi:hypothetical protein